MSRYNVGQAIGIFDEEPVVYGHVNEAAFIEAMVASDNWDRDDVQEYLPLKLAHEWWRMTPAPKDDPDIRSYVHPAEPHARGAFPVTVRVYDLASENA